MGVDVAKCLASKLLRSTGEDFWCWGGEAGSFECASVANVTRAGRPGTAYNCWVIWRDLNGLQK